MPAQVNINRSLFKREVSELESYLILAERMGSLPKEFISNVKSWIRDIRSKFGKNDGIEWSDVKFLRKVKRAISDLA